MHVRGAAPPALTGQGSDADRCYQDGRSAGTEGSRTRRWREKDSNPRSPVRETFFSNPLIKWQRAAQNELCDRRNDQVLDAAKFKQGDGANEAGFGGIAPKTIENKGGSI